MAGWGGQAEHGSRLGGRASGAGGSGARLGTGGVKGEIGCRGRGVGPRLGAGGRD